jgi:hypothetical protein
MQVRRFLSYATSALLALLSGIAVSTANAVTVDVTIVNGATTIATGSFSYSSASPTIDYADLTAFTLMFDDGSGAVYNLSFVQNAPQYDYFAYQPSTNTLLTTSSNYAGIPDILSAIDDGFDYGFFLNPTALTYTDYAPLGGFDLPYTAIDLAVASAPLPATWTMMLIGLAGLGFVGYRQSRKGALPLSA